MPRGRRTVTGNLDNLVYFGEMKSSFWQSAASRRFGEPSCRTSLVRVIEVTEVVGNRTGCRT